MNPKRPDPLTPPDCDLRGYDYMPLFGHRLFASSFNDHATDTEFRIAIRLWWSAWQQCPSGSLPNDEAALARLSEFGRDVKGWRKVKDAVLRGFVLCSDGRLYHPMLCDAAVRAYDMKLKADSRRETDRKRLQAWRDAKRKRDAESGGNDSGSGSDTLKETADETRFTERVETADETQNVDVEQERNRKEGKEGEGKPPYAPLAEADAPAEPSPTRTRAPTGTRLPDGWQPGASAAAFAAGLGLDLPEAVAEFSDYWRAVPGSKGRKLDWDGTFRNRCRERAGRLRPKLALLPPPPRRPARNGALEWFIQAREQGSPMSPTLPDLTDEELKHG